MSRDIQRAANQFLGDRVCLDFANTLDWRTSSEPQELIPSYEALIEWSARRRTMAADAIRGLRARAARHPRQTQDVMRDAYTLRAEVWSIADALRAGSNVKLTAVNAMTSGLLRQPALIREGSDYVYNLKGEDLAQPLWPILWSLTALLTSNDASRVGMCHADGCGWFFVDESPNRSRLWCSSEVCGNRERARRAYAKRRGPPTRNSRESS
jgi:predicted RNA-binding Zn ribbon-like protein